MKNNKGFSLVELIIVIAIMAILVGVMAPQLIKYIEKSNVSADTQLCDSIHTAVVTAMMDPEVLSDPSTSVVPSGGIAAYLDVPGGDKFKSAVADILGVTGVGEITLKSHTTGNVALSASDISISVDNNRCYVWIVGSDATGSKNGSSGTIITVY